MLTFVTCFFVTGTAAGLGMVVYQLMKDKATGCFEFYGGIVLVFICVIGLIIVLNEVIDMRPIYMGIGQVIFALALPTVVVGAVIGLIIFIGRINRN